MEISCGSLDVLEEDMLNDERKNTRVMVVFFDKWVEHTEENERIFSMFIQSFLELTDGQFACAYTYALAQSPCLQSDVRREKNTKFSAHRAMPVAAFSRLLSFSDCDWWMRSNNDADLLSTVSRLPMDSLRCHVDQSHVLHPSSVRIARHQPSHLLFSTEVALRCFD